MKPSYRAVKYSEGQRWICRVNSGEDVYYAIQQFAIDNGIKYARIHCSVMGGLQPAKFLVWTPDTGDITNWHNETEMVVQNLSMILSMSGIIHLRKGKDGKMEPFPAIHFVIGGGWDVPTVGGHMFPGTIAKGNLEFFVTETLGIEAIIPPEEINSTAPESWYIETE